jgi:hypothetical protein
MKKVVVICFVLMWQGLNSFGQTNNAPPPTSRPVPRPEQPAQKAATNNIASAPMVSAHPTFSHTSEIPPEQLAQFRRIKEEGLLEPGVSRNGRNTWASVESIFRSDNDQAGDSCIRDTYVTIFPTGR